MKYNNERTKRMHPNIQHIILMLIVMVALMPCVSAIDIPSCDTCHGKHNNCGNCHSDDHHRDYPHTCFECHGTSVDIHHALDKSNCISCHGVYTIQKVPHFPDNWRECNNCHTVNHHAEDAEDNCAECHGAKSNDKCQNCHKRFPDFKEDWDSCDSCHSMNKHSNCDSCHSNVDHHLDVKGQCSECHIGGSQDSNSPDKQNDNGNSDNTQGKGNHGPGYLPDDITDAEPDTDDDNKCDLGLHAPGLGLGWNGSVAGDKLPILYTWRDNLCVQHTTDYHPVKGQYISNVLITPAQVAGEPIQEYSYKDSARYQRLMQWKANHNK